MGLLDKLRAELVDIIEWVDDPGQTLLWRFPRYANEIKNGAQLVVRPGQVAIFVSQGKVADVFEPGQYTLTTPNLPVLSTLQGWKYGFSSPFKAEVYFASTRQITGLKWRTQNPMILRDADFGAVRVRAFGTYTLRALDPKILLTHLVSTHANFETGEVSELLRSIITTAFADLLGSQKIAVVDLASHQQTLSESLRKSVAERIDDEYGLQIDQLFIVNVSLPEDVEKALDTRTSMNVVGDMDKFTQFQMGQAVVAAAKNPGGDGAVAQGLGLGAGVAMGNRFMGAAAPGASAGTPPPPPVALYHVSVAGQSQGPWTVEQLVNAIARGEVRGDTLVWSAGMQAWTAAAQVPSLSHYFAAPPPPPAPR